ncbi:LytTR family DNA-binding domain-containing protein [Hymenobacter sp. BT728]|nr:LytTR family DNA-binding domain-containing protein [Hymenobacter pini]
MQPTTTEKPLTCVILEDDLLIRELVVGFVEQVPGLQLAAAFEHPVAAFDYLSQHPVDLLISDIELPGLSGLELVRSLRQPPLVIFITSHAHYAAQTYDLDAVDFLPKPLAFQRFLRAVDKALLMFRARQQWQQPTEAGPPALETHPEDFFIRTELQYVRLRYADVLYVEAMRDFTKLHLVDGTVHITLVNLKHLEEQLPARHFMRTHRSFLVNADKIDVITGQDVQVQKKLVPLSLSYRDAVTERVVQNRLITRRR